MTGNLLNYKTKPPLLLLMDYTIVRNKLTYEHSIPDPMFFLR